jgi:hypothetical protein
MLASALRGQDSEGIGVRGKAAYEMPTSSHYVMTPGWSATLTLRIMEG